MLAAAPHAQRFRSSRLLELAASLLAVFGVIASLVPDYLRLRILHYPGVDFKVVYVSTWLMMHGGDPYNLAQIPAAYSAVGFATPETLYGRSPVYPPLTYMTLSPLAWLSGPAATWVFLLASALVMSFAVAALARVAREQFQLTWPWRLGLIACCGACPLLAFGLQIANVSVLTAALCVLAITSLRRRPYVPAVALALALLLKPHVALWVWLALALAYGRPGRRVAALAVGTASFVGAITVVWLTSSHALASTVHSFFALLHAEQGNGSMSPASREILPLGAQITGISTLSGFFSAPSFVSFCLLLVPIVLLAGLLYLSWTCHGDIVDPAARLLFTGAFVALGLVVTYHRAHDSQALFLVLPAIVAGIRDRDRSLPMWLAIGGLLSLCVPWGSATPGSQGLAAFLLLRQAAIAAFTVAVALTWLVAKKGGTNGRLFVPGGQ